ncbi:MAG TPA: hypothetical protein IAD11_06135 [Candidatus Stercorousia faecigallinarum]|nr:hypothetical protein [Candidatus Stercorousia faecigallinarum]
MTDTNKDYEVGYKKPPKEYQFKPGVSGNPKGRPKLIQDFKSDFQDELEEVITLKEGGNIKTMTKQRALIKRLITNALNGNAASIKLVTSIMSSLPIKPKDIEADLSIEDAQILKDFIERNTK